MGGAPQRRCGGRLRRTQRLAEAIQTGQGTRRRGRQFFTIAVAATVAAVHFALIIPAAQGALLVNFLRDHIASVSARSGCIVSQGRGASKPDCLLAGRGIFLRFTKDWR